MSPTQVVRGLDLLLTMDPTLGEGPLGRLEHAAVALDERGVCWIGSDDQAPTAPVVVQARGQIGLPLLVDSHTHSVWAGSRADEWERRLSGISYTEILEAGGGIRSTVRHTRQASLDELVELCTARLAPMVARGVGAMEIKSGYGLDAHTERTMLQAAGLAGQRVGMTVVRTFLGAHCVPSDCRDDPDGYVDDVVGPQLAACADVADFVDVYVDRGAFTVDQGRRVLQKGIAAGLRPRIHAEQVTYTGAARMAAELGAVSADHLEQIDEDGIAAMAKAGTIGVMLPGAQLYLNDPSPPVPMLREAGVRMAVATDLNPGSSPVDNLWTCATLACVRMGLSVEEALLGITAVGADVLARPDLGRLRVGSAGLVLARPRAGEPCVPGALLQHLGGPSVSVIRPG